MYTVFFFSGHVIYLNNKGAEFKMWSDCFISKLWKTVKYNYAVPKLCGKVLKNFLLDNIVVEIIVRYSAFVCDSQILLIPHSISFFF